MPQIKITVNKYGDTKIDAEGFVGEGCIAATQAIELALKGESGSRHLKPEYDQQGAGMNTETESLRF